MQLAIHNPMRSEPIETCMDFLMLMRNAYQSAARVKAGEWNRCNQYKADSRQSTTAGEYF
jgi:site-specific DNA-adenine methylase